MPSLYLSANSCVPPRERCQNGDRPYSIKPLPALPSIPSSIHLTEDNEKRGLNEEEFRARGRFYQEWLRNLRSCCPVIGLQNMVHHIVSNRDLYFKCSISFFMLLRAKVNKRTVNKLCPMPIKARHLQTVMLSDISRPKPAQPDRVRLDERHIFQS